MNPLLLMLAGATCVCIVILLILAVASSNSNNNPPVPPAWQPGSVPRSGVSGSWSDGTYGVYGVTGSKQYGWIKRTSPTAHKPAIADYIQDGLWRKHDTASDPGWWNPYAAPGQTTLNGGIFPPFGTLPVVNPPASRYKAPYNMEPTWQTGDASINDEYTRKCRPAVRGQLYYLGPHSMCGPGGRGCEKWPGAWVWVRHWVDSKGRHHYDMGSAPTNMFEAASASEAVRQGHEETARMDIQDGLELPPWYRRGKNATPNAIRKYCAGSRLKEPPFAAGMGGAEGLL
jgi:hypothetical protein